MNRAITLAVISIAVCAGGVTGQTCGDFNGDGWLTVVDAVNAINYLYMDGVPPFDYDWADADGYQRYTLNDLAILTRHLFLPLPPPICPPGPDILTGPVNDSIYLHTFETSFPAAEMFPPGQNELAVHYHLTTDVPLSTVSLAFRMRVAGEIPTIDSVTLPPSDMTSFQYLSKVNHDSGKVAIGLIAVSSDNNIPPGTYEYGYVYLSVPPMDSVWRPITVEWDSLTAGLDAEWTHYPFAVGAGKQDVWTPSIYRFPCIGEIRGNVDYDPDDGINITDLVYLVTYMFQSGWPPVCFEEVDLEVDLQLDISDLIYLVNYMFQAGPPPPPCP